MNKQIRLLTIFFAALFYGAATAADAQVATGGNYTLDQAVIASGGGQNSAGGDFSIDGTIGQSIAAPNSSNPPFSVAGGFWTAAPLAPTAASVSISGRLLTADGRGLTNARVILTDASGTQRATNSGSFGFYRFDEIEVGQTYIISVVSRRYQFTTQIVTILDEIENLDFIAQP